MYFYNSYFYDMYCLFNKDQIYIQDQIILSYIIKWAEILQSIFFVLF